MAEELRDRKDVPGGLTWDLSGIYATQEDMFRDAEKMEKLAQEIAAKFKGKLNTAKAMEECVTMYRKVYELMTLTLISAASRMVSSSRSIISLLTKLRPLWIFAINRPILPRRS